MTLLQSSSHICDHLNSTGGVGLTLIAADRVIIYDPDWTSALDAQAVDRCYRIGQTKPVVAYRFITAGTVEEKVYERQVHKEGINKAILTEGGTDSVERHFKLSELAQLFTLGEAGVAKFMKKVNKEHHDAGLRTDWSVHEFVAIHPGVVGLSRHDALYSGVALKEPEKVQDVESGDAHAVHGRAQRVLHKERVNDPQPLLKVSSAQPSKLAPSLPLISENALNLPISDGEIAVARKSVGLYSPDERTVQATVEPILAQASALKRAGKPRQALQGLMSFLENDGKALDDGGKERVHVEIASYGVDLGLM
jgi:hypothetical protein